MSQSAENNECPICQRTFKRNEHLIRHLRTHTQERPFGCPLCEKSFTRQDTLKRHLIGHADEPSSNEHGKNSQPEHSDWRDVEQWLEPESCADSLDNAEAPNLDWFDALTTTIQPVSGQSFSKTEDPLFVADEPSRTAMYLPTDRPNSAVVMQSRPARRTAPNGRKPQCLSNELLHSHQPSDLKLPPELFNSMVDDYARKWLRDLCNK